MVIQVEVTSRSQVFTSGQTIRVGADFPTTLLMWNSTEDRRRSFICRNYQVPRLHIIILWQKSVINRRNRFSFLDLFCWALQNVSGLNRPLSDDHDGLEMFFNFNGASRTMSQQKWYRWSIMDCPDENYTNALLLHAAHRTVARVMLKGQIIMITRHYHHENGQEKYVSWREPLLSMVNLQIS